MKYRAFADECRLKIKGQHVDLANCHVTFILPMPKSWSKKKRSKMVLAHHMQKPDLDNLFKALADALHGDDSHIHTIACEKVWGKKAGIIITYEGEVS